MTTSSTAPSLASRLPAGTELLAHLVGREFRLRHRRSILGWLWALLLPLARLLVLAFVFTRVIPLDIENYTAHLYIGLLAWIWFSTGVMSATTSVIDRSDLLLRPGLARGVVPMISVTGDTVDYLLALPMLLLYVAVTIGINWWVLALPLLFLAQYLLILGIGYLLAPLNVLFRDVGKVVEVVLLLGFYATPVFYDPSAIPESYRGLLDYNPMAHVLRAQRTVLIDGRWPGTTTVFGLLAIGAAVAAIGYVAYARPARNFLDEL